MRPQLGVSLRIVILMTLEVSFTIVIFLKYRPLVYLAISWQAKSLGRVKPGNPYWRGRLSTVDLLALTSLDQLLFIMQTLCTFLQNKATLMRRSTVPSLPLQLVFLGETL
jgi:hypothetical protein